MGPETTSLQRAPGPAACQGRRPPDEWLRQSAPVRAPAPSSDARGHDPRRADMLAELRPGSSGKRALPRDFPPPPFQVAALGFVGHEVAGVLIPLERLRVATEPTQLLRPRHVR